MERPTKTAARVRLGQAVMECRANTDGLERGIEALPRAPFKTPNKKRVNLAFYHGIGVFASNRGKLETGNQSPLKGFTVDETRATKGNADGSHRPIPDADWMT
jgi:hypothetical protein